MDYPFPNHRNSIDEKTVSDYALSQKRIFQLTENP